MFVANYLWSATIVLGAVLCETSRFQLSQLVPVDYSTLPAKQVDTNTDLGTCECDLTVNMCDINCCCDTHCSATEKKSFQYCGNSTSWRSSVYYCSSQLYKSNAAVGKVQTSSGSMCIMYNNNAYSGTYFKNPGPVPNDAVFTEQVNSVPNKYSLGPLVSDNPTYQSSTVDGIYKAGTPVQAQFLSSGSQVTGYLAQPRPDSMGLCTDSSPARFLESETTSCKRVFSEDTIEATCRTGGILDANYFVNDRLLIADVPGGVNPVPLIIRNIQCLDTTGETKNCTFSGSGSSNTTSPAIQYPQAVFDPVTNVCKNALTLLNYTIIYDDTSSSLSVKTVYVELVVSDVKGNVVTQTYSTYFISNTALNTDVVYSSSGSSGYIRGAPILAGILTSSNGKDAMSFIPNILKGLTLPATKPVTGKCTGSTSLDFNYRIPVTFGEDTLTGCVIELTTQDLMNNCSEIRKRVLEYQTGALFDDNEFKGGNTGFTHVGMFGGSSVDPSQWVPLSGTTPPSEFTAQASSSSSGAFCDNILTEYDIQIIYVPLGSIDNPQYSIVGARFQYVSGSFQYRCYSGQCDGISSNGTSKAQPFSIRSSATFVQVSNEGYQVTKGVTHRAEATVPNDLLYPLKYRELNLLASSSAALLPSFFVMIIITSVTMFITCL